MSNDKKWIIGTVISIFLMFSVVIAFLWKIWIFDSKGSPDASAKIVASALALVGSFIATLVSIVGLYLRQSIERRNLDLKEQEGKRLLIESKRNVDLKEQEEKRLQIESERNNVLQKEAENRLKVEAAMKAVGLLSTSSGGVVPDIQKAGVLFTLATLDQLDLAITLLRAMVEKDAIDMNSAVVLIDRTLKSNDELCQEMAAEILDTWPDKLLISKGNALFPACAVREWNPKVSVEARFKVARAWVKLITARLYKKWEKQCLISFFATLYEILIKDTDERLKLFVGLCLNKVLKFSPEPKEEYMQLLSMSFDISDLHEKLEKMGLEKEKLLPFYVPTLDMFERWLTHANISSN